MAVIELISLKMHGHSPHVDDRKHMDTMPGIAELVELSNLAEIPDDAQGEGVDYYWIELL